MNLKFFTSARLRTFLNRRMARNSAVAFAAVICIVSASRGFDESAGGNSAGLRGILPEVTPDAIYDTAFEPLDGKWTEWGQQVANDVIDFYESEEELSVEEQRAALAGLKRKIGVMKKALDDSRYRSLHVPISTLHGALGRRVDMAEAVLDTLDVDEEAAKDIRLQAARRSLQNAVDDLANYLRPIRGGSAWLGYFNTNSLSDGNPDAAAAVKAKLANRGSLPEADQRDFVSRPAFGDFEAAVDQYLESVALAEQPLDREKLRESLAALVAAAEAYEADNSSEAAAALREAYNAASDIAPDGGQILSSVMRSHYFNYNLRIVASEAFLKRMVYDRRNETGPVCDFILGANVSGNQWTTTDVGLDLKPSNQSVRFDITLAGTTQSSTQGVTEQATIFTSGYHNFWAYKEVRFDGDSFSTSPARVSVNANNTTTGARTTISGFPIFGSIADSIAVRAAEKKRPQSEAIARGRVSSKVAPRLDSEVNEQFAQVNRDMESETNARLKELGLYPDAKSFRSTDTQMRASTRLMHSGEAGGGQPGSTVNSSNGLVAHVHESLMNNSMARLNLAGRTMTEADLQAEIEDFFSRLTGEEFKFEEDPDAVPEPAAEEEEEEKEPAVFIFPDSDPIRMRARDGVLTLIIRTGLKQPDDEDIPTQIIEVPLSFEIQGDNILVTSGEVAVKPVERPSSLTVQIARAGIVRSRIQDTLPDREFDRVIAIDRGDGQGTIDVKVTEIAALDGWLSVVVE